jgi:hypothetical protein
MSYALLSQRTSTTTGGGVLPSATSDNQFRSASITTKDTDESTIATLASNQLTLATGTYRIRAQVMFGTTPSLNGLHGKAVLFSVTSSTAKTNKGTSTPIVGTAMVAPDLSGTNNANFTCHIAGRFEVTLPSEVLAIQMAGNADTGTWYNTTTAQGVAASSVTAGSYQNVFKVIELLKE